MNSTDSAEQYPASRRGSRGENRLPPIVAVVIAAITYALLPESLWLGSHMRTTMVLDAIEMARWSRGTQLEGLRWCCY